MISEVIRFGLAWLLVATLAALAWAAWGGPIDEGEEDR